MKMISMLLAMALLGGMGQAADEKPEAPAGAVGGAAVGQILKEQEGAERQKQWEETLKKLAGTEWRLERMGGKDSAKGPSSTISFKDDGTASGSTGVNRFGGAFKMENGKFKTGPFMTTRRGGPPEAMAQEQAFVKALSSVQSVTLADGKLVIKSGCGCGCGGDCKDGCKTCGPECGCKGNCPPSTALEFMSADKGHPVE